MLGFNSRCFYTYSREYFDQPHFYWKIVYIDLLTSVYSIIRLLYIIYNLRWKNEKIVAQHQTVDPILNFFSHIDILLVWIVLSFIIYHTFAKVALARVNVSLPMWRFWRQTMIELQDHYFWCVLDTERLTIVQEKTAKMLTKKYPIFIKGYLPNWTLEMLTKLYLIANFENLDQRQFNALISQQKSITGQPNLSMEVKKKTVLLLLVIEKWALFHEVMIGK